MPRRKPQPDARRRPGRPIPRPANPAIDLERQRRQREICASKARYGSESEARAHALMHQPGPGDRPSTYHCEVCAGWHFTSRR